MKSTARHRNSLSRYLLLLIIFVSITDIDGLQNVSVIIPEAVAIGSTVTLTCLYDLQKNELYAVKWYKGKAEFYRYLPKEMPPISVFGDIASKVDKSKSDEHHLTLTNVTNDLDGKYRCEVTSDLGFLTRLKSGYMHIAILPEGNPELLVEKQRYMSGEVVKANCSTPPSNPAANITWTVNNHLMQPKVIKNIQINNDNRSKTYSEVEFSISQENSFNNSRLQIICHANVFQLYKKMITVYLDEERPRLASVLGTRDSPPHTGGALKTTGNWLYVITTANLLLYGLR